MNCQVFLVYILQLYCIDDTFMCLILNFLVLHGNGSSTIIWTRTAKHLSCAEHGWFDLILLFNCLNHDSRYFISEGMFLFRNLIEGLEHADCFLIDKILVLNFFGDSIIWGIKIIRSLKLLQVERAAIKGILGAVSDEVWERYFVSLREVTILELVSWGLKFARVFKLWLGNSVGREILLLWMINYRSLVWIFFFHMILMNLFKLYLKILFEILALLLNNFELGVQLTSVWCFNSTSTAVQLWLFLNPILSLCQCFKNRMHPFDFVNSRCFALINLSVVLTH